MPKRRWQCSQLSRILKTTTRLRLLPGAKPNKNILMRSTTIWKKFGGWSRMLKQNVLIYKASTHQNPSQPQSLRPRKTPNRRKKNSHRKLRSPLRLKLRPRHLRNNPKSQGQLMQLRRLDLNAKTRGSALIAAMSVRTANNSDTKAWSTQELAGLLRP